MSKFIWVSKSKPVIAIHSDDIIEIAKQLATKPKGDK